MKTHTSHKQALKIFNLLLILAICIQANAQSTAARLIGVGKYDYVSNTWHQVDSVRFAWWSNFGGDFDHNIDDWKITNREEINSNYSSINWANLDVYSYNSENQQVLKTFAQWDGSVYQNTNRYTDSFDAQGRMVQELEEGWVAGAWQKSYLTIDSFNANGLLAQEYDYNWVSATSSWVPANINTYAYNNAGLRTLYQRIYWNGTQWNNYEQLIDVYDANNKKITETSTGGNDSIWINGTRLSYQYDDNGNQTIYAYYQWNSGTNSWKNVRRDLYTYNSSNKNTGWTDQQYSTQWDNNYKVDYAYNAANLADSTIVSYWVSGAWKLTSLTLDKYNADGFGTIKRVQYWDGSAFVDSTRATTTRNSNDQTLMILNETYTAGAWSTIGAEYRYYEQYTPVTGITETAENSNSKIYPNPFTKNCLIEFNTETSGENLIQVFDLNGKLVKQENNYFPAGNNKWMFDGNTGTGEEIAKGFYVLKVSNSQQSFTQKILKI